LIGSTQRSSLRSSI